MVITEVRIKLTEDSDDRLQAFCSITFDNCFVVRDLKIIEGSNGPFVAMPSRKLTSRCSRCGSKNHLRANYCNQCGVKLPANQAVRDQQGRAKLYADVAHPINSDCREMIQKHVIAEFHSEVELAKEPGYMSRYEDEYEEDFTAEHLLGEQREEREEPQQPEQPEQTSLPETAFERTDREPEPLEPRPPHSAPNRRPAESRAGGPHRRRRDFGAGIFED